MRKSKFLYLSASKYPSKKASSIHVAKMVNSLSIFYQVTLVARGAGLSAFSAYDMQAINIVLIKKSYLPFIIMNLITVVNILLKDRWSVIYGRHTISVFISSFFSRNCYYESHSMPQSSYIKALEYILISLKMIKGLVVISDALRRDYLKKFKNLPPDFILVAHDGADIPKNISELPMKNMRLNSFDYTFGYVGHLYEGRGIDIIVELAKKNKNYMFIVVGGDDENVSRLKSETSDLDNIVFEGFVQNRNLYKYYQLFDIVLAPYKDEPNQSKGNVNTTKWMSPMKIFEYMSFKIPIIVSDLPVIREVLNDESCYFVSDSSYSSWNDVLKIAVNDSDEKIKSKAINAYSILKNLYTWKKRAYLIKRFIDNGH